MVGEKSLRTSFQYCFSREISNFFVKKNILFCLSQKKHWSKHKKNCKQWKKMMSSRSTNDSDLKQTATIGSKKYLTVYLFCYTRFKEAKFSQNFLLVKASP